MKIFILSSLLFLFVSCNDDYIVNDCFRNLRLNEIVYLNNPEFINLKIPNGNAITTLGGRNILIIRQTSNYKAFDLSCPEADCNKPMSFDGLKIKCSCSKKEYNSLNGSPIDGKGCFALEYNVTVSGNTLQISKS